ncbi:MAG: hypothetical protein M1824_001413 [Vezdaea acicularis]|nr:MAG: hypothetical protein M1824_001413 [Vezdaea acicularis]
MASSFEKSVKGGTKIKLAAPKSKYVEHILVATHTGDAGVAEIFRALQPRLRDSTWTIVFKGLIIVHVMMREGEPDVTLKYLASNPRKLAISNFSDGGYRTQLLGQWLTTLTRYDLTVQVQGQNIRNYSQYLLERASAYKETKVDYVRSGEGRLKKQSVEKGLLRETEAVQRTIAALLKCDVLTTEIENEITLTAFTLLVQDLLALFYVMNEEHFLEMSKYDAERALGIYKKFSRQTNQVVEYLSVARQYETATRLEVPKIKHAPTGLTSSLEEYCQDPDFEINRRQYLVQQEAKKSGGRSNGASNKPFGISGASSQAKSNGGDAFPSAKPIDTPKAEPKGPAPDLIDFFESIEQNQQPMANELSPEQQQQMALYNQQQQQQQLHQQQAQFQQYQQSGFAQQSTGFPQQQQQPQFSGGFGQQDSSSPFGQAQQQTAVQPNFTGAGFGGYTPQPTAQPPFNPQQSSLSSIPQNGIASFDNNKFLPQTQMASGSPTLGQQQTTNPFRQSMMSSNTGSTNSSFSSTPTSTAAPRGTNPFAKMQTTGQSTATSYSTSSPITSMSPQSMPQVAPQQLTQELRSGATATNPFARQTSPPQAAMPFPQPSVTANPTGSTNPFRQSQLPGAAQATSGWQPGQPTLGGYEQLPTVPIFPRPQEQQGQQQGGQGW